MNKPPKGDEYRRGNSAAMMFQPSAQDTPNMTVRIRQGSFWVNSSTFVEYNGGSSPTIVAPKTGAKWVVIVVNKLGTALVVDGVARVNNPEAPELAKNLLPVAFVYIKSSTKAITNDMIYDARPTLAVGGYPTAHNQLQHRDDSNCHPIAAITDLQDKLDDKLDLVDASDLLYAKADSDGTYSSTFTLNNDETGVPVEYCGVNVNRGSLPTVGIRFNEDSDAWEYTNDGSTWSEFSSGVAQVPLANSFTHGASKLSVEPDDESDPIAVGANDPLFKTIIDKVNRGELSAYATTAALDVKLADKADVQAVYSKADAETIFVTRAEYVDKNDTFTKQQVNDMMALKANISQVYTQAAVDAKLGQYYTSATVDALLKTVSGGSSPSLLNYYNKSEVDALIAKLAATGYDRSTVDTLLATKADVASTASQLATKADVANVYTKTEVDAKLVAAGTSTGTPTNVYTKGEVDAFLSGKAALAHGHNATDIIQDANHRLVTDDEITKWNTKQDALGYTPLDATKLGVAGGVAQLDSTGKIPVSLIPSSVMAGTGGVTIVSTYADMTALKSPYAGQQVFVVDATTDPSGTVKSGWAEYIYDNSGVFQKIGERESLDLILNWSNVVNKPTVFAADPASLTAYAQTANTYTKTEVDNLLVGKSDTTHNHDTRYPTTAQVSSLLADKLDKSAVDLTKIHAAAQLGTLTVDESGLADGNVLSYSATSGKLVYKAVSGGSGTQTPVDYFKLGTQTVDESALTNGYALTYDATAKKLVYSDPAAKLGTAPVDESAMAGGKVLTYDAVAKKLVYTTLPNRGTHDFDESNIADGRLLSYNAASGKVVYVDPPKIGGTSTGLTMVEFEVPNSTGGECLVCASSTDVTYKKVGVDVFITPGAGVRIFWVRYRITETEMAGKTSAKLDFNTNGPATDYSKIVYPVVTFFADDDGNRAMVKNIAQNLNTNPHTIEFTGMAVRGFIVRVDY